MYHAVTPCQCPGRDSNLTERTSKNLTSTPGYPACPRFCSARNSVLSRGVPPRGAGSAIRRQRTRAVAVAARVGLSGPSTRAYGGLIESIARSPEHMDLAGWFLTIAFHHCPDDARKSTVAAVDESDKSVSRTHRVVFGLVGAAELPGGRATEVQFTARPSI